MLIGHSRYKLISLLLSAPLLAACSPSPDQLATLTASAQTATAAAWTATPTSTATSTTTATATATMTPTPIGGGGRLIFIGDTDPTGQTPVYIIGVDGSHQRQLFATDDLIGLYWSTIVFANYRYLLTTHSKGRHATVELVDLESGSSQQVAAMDNNRISALAGSPDGKQVIFNGAPKGNAQVWAVNVDGSDLRALTDTSRAVQSLDWSPDGRRIVFYTYTGGPDEIYSMNPDGTDEKRLSANGANPKYSPDGKYIAYTVEKGGVINCWLMNPDGSNQRQLTDLKPYLRSGMYVSYPTCAWSSDTAKVLVNFPISFINNNPRSGEISETYLLDLDGNQIANPFDGTSGARSNITLSPDMTMLAFTEGDQVYLSNVDGSNKHTVAMGTLLFWIP